jgi:hypothetical protein
MKTTGLISLSMLLICLSFLMECSKKDDTPPVTDDTWDIDAKGIPKFVETNYIELDKIYRISKFRSSAGHDYSDAFEHCRSMKHYFEPKSTLDWTTVKIYSPVSGTVTRLEQEWAGTKLEIASTAYPAFRFSIFHINLTVQLQLNDTVSAGEMLGTHIGSQTTSDISIIVNDPTKQGRMVSWFEVMSDAVFQQYSAKGVTSRESMIISKQERDAHPLSCSGDTFLTADSLESWVILSR